MQPDPVLSIIVPVYNEVETITYLLDRLLALRADGIEIIVVEDGSSDGSAAVLHDYADSEKIRLVSHSANLGKGAALRTGLAMTRGRYVAIQDADLEYDPAQLLELLAIAEQENAAAVYGVRFANGRPPGMRWRFWLGNLALTKLVNRAFGASLQDVETCYKLVDAKVLKEMDLRSSGFEVEIEITSKLLASNVRIFESPVTYQARKRGKKIRALRDGYRSLLTLLPIWRGYARARRAG